MYESFDSLGKEDVAVVVGTNGSVVPIDDLLFGGEALKILCNLEKSKYINDKNYDYVFYDKAVNAADKIREISRRVFKPRQKELRLLKAKNYAVRYALLLSAFTALLFAFVSYEYALLIKETEEAKTEAELVTQAKRIRLEMDRFDPATGKIFLFSALQTI